MLTAECTAPDTAWRRRLEPRSAECVPASSLFRGLVDAPRWLLLGTLIFAPWAYGSTREWAIQVLDVVLGLIGLLWAAGCLARRRWPDVPRFPMVFAGGLLALGWWMALNAHHRLDPAAWSLQPHPQWVTGAPGSADGATSIAAMFTGTGLLGVLLFSCELARNPRSGAGDQRKSVTCTSAQSRNFSFSASGNGVVCTGATATPGVEGKVSTSVGAAARRVIPPNQQHLRGGVEGCSVVVHGRFILRVPGAFEGQLGQKFRQQPLVGKS